jgi:CheY-like chemotaxis protein
MKHSILIVDDNDVNLELLGRILEMEGYRIMKAHNGMAAIQSVMNEMPDLAILDVMMPDIDGYELCRRLRNPPLEIKIPIVMLTAMNSDTEKAHALEAGANEIWSKPYQMDAFTDRLRELLKSS